LIGCGGGGSGGGGGGGTTYHQVSFYDANLDWNATITAEQGTINPSDLLAGSWYEANATSPTATHSLTQAVNFYAIPSVQEITDQTGLNGIRSDLSGKYILLNDIALIDGVNGVDATNGWLPIGDSLTKFTGVFNGSNHKITNLWIDRASTDYIGLFGVTDGATIKNLGVEIPNSKEVKGQQYVGAIAGYVDYGSTIKNSYAEGNISATSYYVGGITGGVNNDSNISNSYATGNVNGTGSVGGIAGLVYNGSTISNSYATGDISATGGSAVGGIAGEVYSSTIANSYADGNISATGNYIGGIVGFVADGSTIQNNAAINPSVAGNDKVNRAVGFINGSNTVSNNFALDAMTINGVAHSGAYNNQSGVSKTDTQLKTQTTYSNAINGDGLGGLGWLFGDSDSAPWKIEATVSYPYLYWQDN
jgi:hypothetical protein